MAVLAQGQSLGGTPGTVNQPTMPAQGNPAKGLAATPTVAPAATQPAQAPAQPQTGTDASGTWTIGPNGQKLYFQNGQWKPLTPATGATAAPNQPIATPLTNSPSPTIGSANGALAPPPSPPTPPTPPASQPPGTTGTAQGGAPAPNTNVAAPAAAAQQASTGYTPAQQQVLQQAIASASQPFSSETAGAYDQNIMTALQNSGQFSAAQLQQVQQGMNAAEPGGSGFNLQNAGGGNTAGMEASWLANIDQSLGGASSQTGATGTPNPNAQTQGPSNPGTSPTQGVQPGTGNATNTVATPDNFGAYLTPSTIASQFPNGLPAESAATLGTPAAVNAQQISGIPSVSPGQISSLPTVQAGQISNIPQVNAQQIMGLPQVNAQQISGLPGVSAQNINNVPSVQAQNVNAPNSIVAGMGGSQAYSAQSAIDAAQNYLAPQFQQQDSALTEALANAGIVGGSTGSAMNQLGQQQQTTLQQDIQPFIQQEQQLEQSGLSTDAANKLQQQTTNQAANLTAQQANQGANLSAQTANQGAGLTAQQANQGTALSAQTSNQGANLSAQEQMLQSSLSAQQSNQSTGLAAGQSNQGAFLTGAQANQQAGLTAQQANLGANLTAQQSNQSTGLAGQEANQGAFLQGSSLNQSANLQAQEANQTAGMNAGEFNVNALNQGQQFNIGNAYNTANTDASTYNNMQQYIANLQNTDWLAQLGATTSLATAGMGVTAQAFNPIYQQPQPVNLSGFGAFAGGGATPNTTPTPMPSAPTSSA